MAPTPPSATGIEEQIMSEPGRIGSAPTGAPAPVSQHRRTGWVGWVWFAGSLLVLLGAFNVIVGLVALVNGPVLVAGAAGALLFSVTGWGWVHLTIGVLLVLVGGGLFTGNAAARFTAVILVGLNAIAHLTFLPVYPAWSLLIIVLDVLVLWAVLVHGDEARA